MVDGGQIYIRECVLERQTHFKLEYSVVWQKKEHFIDLFLMDPTKHGVASDSGN